MKKLKSYLLYVYCKRKNLIGDDKLYERKNYQK